MVIIITLAFIVAAGLLIKFWTRILFFYKSHVAPIIEEYCGSKVKELFDNVMCVVNGMVTVTNLVGRALWKAFVSKIPKSWIEYRKISPEYFSRKEQVMFTTKEGEYRVHTVEEKVNESFIPSRIAQQIYDNDGCAKVDSMEILEKQFQEKLIN